MVGAQDGLAAAVGEHHRPAQVASVGPEQERHEGGDLLGLPTSPDWDRELVEEGADLLVPSDLCGHGSLDVAGRDGVEGDARARPWLFWGVATYPAGHRQLGRRIGDRSAEFVAETAGLLFVAGQTRVHQRGRE